MFKRKKIDWKWYHTVLLCLYIAFMYWVRLVIYEYSEIWLVWSGAHHLLQRPNIVYYYSTLMPEYCLKEFDLSSVHTNVDKMTELFQYELCRSRGYRQLRLPIYQPTAIKSIHTYNFDADFNFWRFIRDISEIAVIDLRIRARWLYKWWLYFKM